MKKLLLTIGVVVAATQLTACAEDPVKMTFVGTYEINSPYMGIMGGGHLINFNNDGTLDIYAAFYGEVAGASMNHMEGTYTIDGDDVSIEYSFDDTDYETSFTLTDETFATKIYLGASMPSSDVTYYQIDTLSFDKDSKVSIGTINNNGKPLAYAVELKTNNTFNFSGLINTTKVTLSGEYSVPVVDVTEDDTITFTYKTNNTEREESFNYNTTEYFSFNLIHSANTFDTNVKLVRFQ
ncbi:MAG: hypothetical protein R3Y60_02100 [bacterium]